jgi:hypothetical protein
VSERKKADLNGSGNTARMGCVDSRIVTVKRITVNTLPVNVLRYWKPVRCDQMLDEMRQLWRGAM